MDKVKSDFDKQLYSDYLQVFLGRMRVREKSDAYSFIHKARAQTDKNTA
jgi:hypothetical protein